MMFSQCVHLSGTRVHDNLLSVGIHSDPMGRSIGPASCMYLAKHQQRADSVFPRVPLMSSRRILVPELFTLTLQGLLATATVHTLQYLYLSCLDVRYCRSWRHKGPAPNSDPKEKSLRYLTIGSNLTRFSTCRCILPRKRQFCNGFPALSSFSFAPHSTSPSRSVFSGSKRAGAQKHSIADANMHRTCCSKSSTSLSRMEVSSPSPCILNLTWSRCGGDYASPPNPPSSTRTLG